MPRFDAAEIAANAIEYLLCFSSTSLVHDMDLYAGCADIIMLPFLLVVDVVYCTCVSLFCPQSMASFNVSLRPSAQAIASSDVLFPFAQKSSLQLRREIIEERHKTESLSRELQIARDQLRQLQNSRTRAVGRGCERSKSLVYWDIEWTPEMCQWVSIAVEI